MRLCCQPRYWNVQHLPKRLFVLLCKFFNENHRKKCPGPRPLLAAPDRPDLGCRPNYGTRGPFLSRRPETSLLIYFPISLANERIAACRGRSKFSPLFEGRNFFVVERHPCSRTNNYRSRHPYPFTGYAHPAFFLTSGSLFPMFNQAERAPKFFKNGAPCKTETADEYASKEAL